MQRRYFSTAAPARENILARELPAALLPIIYSYCQADSFEGNPYEWIEKEMYFNKLLFNKSAAESMAAARALVEEGNYDLIYWMLKSAAAPPPNFLAGLAANAAFIQSESIRDLIDSLIPNIDDVMDACNPEHIQSNTYETYEEVENCYLPENSIVRMYGAAGFNLEGIRVWDNEPVTFFVREKYFCASQLNTNLKGQIRVDIWHAPSHNSLIYKNRANWIMTPDINIWVNPAPEPAPRHEYVEFSHADVTSESVLVGVLPLDETYLPEDEVAAIKTKVNTYYVFTRERNYSNKPRRAYYVYFLGLELFEETRGDWSYWD